MLVERSEVILSLYYWANDYLREIGAHFWRSDSITENRLSIWFTAYTHGFTHVAVHFEFECVSITRRALTTKLLDSYGYSDPGLVSSLKSVLDSADKLKRAEDADD